MIPLRGWLIDHEIFIITKNGFERGDTDAERMLTLVVYCLVNCKVVQSSVLFTLLG